jgi:hypothetical protein
MHINELRRNHDHLCIELYPIATEKTNALVDACYDFYDSNTFNFSLPASRNVYQSRVHSNILNYLLVTHIWKQHATDVTVDSWALKRILQRHAKKNNVKAQVNLNLFEYGRDLIKIPRRFCLVLRKMFKIRNFAKSISASLKNAQANNNLIFIETDLLVGDFSKQGYSNRSFGSFFELLNEKEKSKTFLVPKLLAASDLRKLQLELKTHQPGQVQIFCKENLFTVLDYFSITLKWINSFVLGFKKNELHLSEFISEELKLKAFSEITFESFVSFFFMKKLKELNIPIKTFISWSENHLYDRAYSKGFLDFSLPFRFSAYQSIILDYEHDFFIRPTSTEVRLNLFPKQIFLAGKEFNRRFVDGNVETFPAPVFRMSAYACLTSEPTQVLKRNTILVGLSLVPSFTDEIMNIALKLAIQLPEYEFKIRCHPLSPKTIPAGFNNVSYDNEKNVVSSLQRSIMFIGTGSSLVLEAAMMQVPTLIVRKKGEYGQNPIPEKFRSIFAVVVTADDDLMKSFSSLVSPPQNIKDLRASAAKQIFDIYVQPIGRRSVEALLG